MELHISESVKRLGAAFVLSMTVLSCSNHSVPVIGVTSFRYDKVDATISSYCTAITGSGAVALVIPYVEDEEAASRIMDKLDGIVFVGGSDIQPSFYGENPINETVQCDTLRDHSDSLIARAALASSKPVLAICRGSQLMNVMLGGTLYQDIPTQVPEAAAHAGGAMMKLGFIEDTFLYDIFEDDSLVVYCGHHQALKDPASGLKVASKASDGIIEAWECGPVWGVQFHPEEFVLHDDKWKLLFDAFVERCK